MIEVKGLSKSFGDHQALKNLDLHVKTGSIYGLIGVNGSGKTTLIKHITGVLLPDSGTVKIDGRDVYDNISVKERLGYIPDDLYFFNSYDLKGMKSFYRGLYPNFSEQRFDAMVKDFGLPEGKKLSKFSKGMQKQAAFALTMSAMPEVLVLDEPVDGLDPVVRHKLWRYVMQDVAERSATVLISSHNLRELEGVCDSVGIISGGEMKLEGDIEDLKNYVTKLRENRGEGTETDLSLEEVFLYEMGEDPLPGAKGGLK